MWLSRLDVTLERRCKSYRAARWINHQRREFDTYVHPLQMQGLRIKGMRRKVETLISDPDILWPQPHVEQ